MKNEVVVYPNQAFNSVSIDLGDVIANEISIINVTGTVVYVNTNINKKQL